MPATVFFICFCFLSEVLEAGSDDPLVIVDQQNAEEETRLPNAHSATFVMGFIFLCLFFYGVYRVCKCHCIQKKVPMTVNLDGDDTPVEGLEKHIKEHNDYLAIFGPKKQNANLHVCEFKKSDSTNEVKQPEP
ncbi:hypothetical protein AVEN_67737-1 [Araneus ventricosus]|uniref:Uncharacterized protein n=1 Tax=Araneus ventricosus TaxID=182803 RepID=A0A4Y2AA56_ARAVE|nr:hypothetical protein AVEN_177347-1 [Araneus ventricosus]GBN70163.1 hypothetical protein AVEN_67737-1 [Araneus ventricosus]